MSTHRVRFSASIRPRNTAHGISWQVRYRLDGQQPTKTFTTEAAARRWAGIVHEIGPTEALKMLGTDAGKASDLESWCATYIGRLGDVQSDTANKYRSYVVNDVAPFFGHTPMDAIGRDRVSAWVQWLARRGNGEKTIKNKAAFLSSAFADAVERENVPVVKNPVRSVKIPRGEPVEMTFLTPAEFELVLGYIPDRYRLLVMLLAGTGLRWGEATALHPTDFDLDAPMPTVRVSRAWKHDTKRTPSYWVGPPKTKKSRRTVALPSKLVTMLRSHLAGMRPDSWVFTNGRGGPVRNGSFADNYWRPAVKRVNGETWEEQPRAVKAAARKSPVHQPAVWKLPAPQHLLGKWPRIHDLRHSHASWLIAMRVRMDVVQARLGHESITTTLDRYSHLMPDAQLAASAAADVALGGSLEPLPQQPAPRGPRTSSGAPELPPSDEDDPAA